MKYVLSILLLLVASVVYSNDYVTAKEAVANAKAAILQEKAEATKPKQTATVSIENQSPTECSAGTCQPIQYTRGRSRGG